MTTSQHFVDTSLANLKVCGHSMTTSETMCCQQIRDNRTMLFNSSIYVNHCSTLDRRNHHDRAGYITLATKVNPMDTYISVISYHEYYLSLHMCHLLNNDDICLFLSCCHVQQLDKYSTVDLHWHRVTAISHCL